MISRRFVPLSWAALSFGAAAAMIHPALAASTAAQAGALPVEISWSDVIPLVERQSPRLRAIRSQVKVAQSEVAVANVLPNPSLDYVGYGRLSHDNQYGTQHQIGLETPLWLAGQRSARKHAAEGRVEVVKAQSAADERSLDAAALQAWLMLLAAQDRFAELTQAGNDVQSVAQIVHERVRDGAESQYDAARVDLESAQLATRIAQADADVAEASANFAAVLGIAGWHPRAIGALANLANDQNFAALWQKAQASLPELRAAEREVQVASSEVEVARAERWPVPTVSGGALITTDAKSTSAYLGLSFPLPIFDAGGASVGRARAALEQSRLALNAAQADARASLGASVEALSAKRAVWAQYEQTVKTRLPGLRDMAETAYKSGSTSLLELLDSVRSQIDVQLEGIDLRHELAAAQLEVMARAGLLNPPSSR
ncbi:MAG TPA: TolC family protein [Polyangiaceae bacterium]|jgi:cobalt-zinc-cadmium efflux system outer membrane protein|nr:TolC family protein [Polyangiaceae bacterium]